MAASGIRTFVLVSFAHRYIIGIFLGTGTLEPVERAADGEMINDKLHLTYFPTTCYNRGTT